ncbi:MAG TPA: diguanylate cyclase [Thermoanaerobaculia bacterium]|nr:diguanylate cyclase [Thermoanaerobaculia bacterium]
MPFIVVIVDQDETVRMPLMQLLRDHGYATLGCGSSREARQMLHEYPWDLAIVARTLPDDDGIRLCHELKSEPELASRFVIVSLEEGNESGGVDALDQGADDFATKPFDHDELLARIRSGKRIVDLSKKLLGLNTQLETLSITDGLTSLYNRRYCDEQIHRAFERAVRYGRPFSLVLFDADHFKNVNDTHGHSVGDRVLREISILMTQTARATDLIARYGGDEFAIIAPETAGENAFHCAERIRKRVAGSPIHVGASEIAMTLSAGVASGPSQALRSAAQVIEEADRALYRAKAAGRNRVELADPSPAAKAE